MDPITLGILGGGALLSAGAQWYFGNQQAENEEARIKAANQISDQLFEQLQGNLPPGEVKPLSYEQYAVLKQYKPEIAQFVEEQYPKLIGEAESQEVKQLQTKAVQEYKALSETGSDAQTEAQRSRLLNDVQGKNNTSRANLLREYSQRGVAGSGQGILAQLGADAATNDQAQQQALDISAQNASRRLDALGKMADLSGTVRNQNSSIEQSNNNTANQYNQRNAMNRNQYLQYQAQQMNDANRFNINQNQNAANQNVGIRNQQMEQNTLRNERAKEALRQEINNNLKSKASARLGTNIMQGQSEAATTNRNIGIAQTLGSGATAVGSAYAKGAKPTQAVTAGAPSSNLTAGEDENDYSNIA